ncbi:MAG TPA: glycoside hydrolase family 15 protein, partial [Longimicrobiales bacterium]|nr:glycoside hydrolase family 15 protein [Longimicrobiales bacterium]
SAAAFSGHRYKPISAYGIIGDMSTAALVGLDGSIDWCCLPRFDAPSLFGALLDAERGGRFRIAPRGPCTAAQRYLPQTNVLATTFELADGSVLEVTDFMPYGGEGRAFHGYHEIHRRISCTRGEAEAGILFEPRFGYGASPVRFRPRRHGVLATDAENEAVTLASMADVWWCVDDDAGRVTAQLRLAARDLPVWVVLRYDDDEVRPIERYEPEVRFEETVDFWRRWAESLRYEGPHRDEVVRSAQVLKLLFYQPTGAIVAAPTTSLPEEEGGVRNWDYRFTWLRDSAFTLNALYAVGRTEEADDFMRFLKRVTRKPSEDHLQIMFGVGGERELPERELEHLEGWRGSRPVRVGNAAYRQLQLDIYGELMETAYLWSQTHEMPEGLWSLLSALADWVCDNWQRRDAGIWEVRSDLQHYVFSKIMCWVALDRAVRMADALAQPERSRRWRTERDRVHAEVLERGWNDARGAFVQHYDTDALDAAALLIPRIGFLPPDDARVRGTVEAIQRELTGPRQELVYRYLNPDGLPGHEGVFSICTFWLADALILMGDIDAGERIFDRMLSHANHLGLYSEQIHQETGDFLGNFPQGLTHIALINTAQLLAWARGGEPGQTLPAGTWRSPERAAPGQAEGEPEREETPTRPS